MACQFFTVQPRAPAFELIQRGRAFDDQALAPGFDPLEAFRLLRVELAARGDEGIDRLEIDIAHELADVLPLARAAAATRDAACLMDGFHHALGQIQLLQVAVAHADQLFAEVLGSVSGALAAAFARAVVLERLLVGGFSGRLRCQFRILGTGAGRATGTILPYSIVNQADVMQQAAESQGIPQLEDVVSFVLEEAKRQGASECEADANRSQGLGVTVRLGEVDTVEYQRDRGLGVTVYFGKRKGAASTADLSRQAVRDTVEKACAIARYTAEDPYAGLIEPEFLARDIPDLDLDHPWAVTPEIAIDLARQCEAAGLAVDPRIANSEGGTVNSQRHTGVYGNSLGFLAGVSSTSHSVSCSLIAQEGDEMQRDYWFTTSRDPADLEAADLIGRIAGQRAIARLGSRKLTTRKAPIAFTPDMARGLIRHFTGAIRGAAQYRKASFLLDAAGTEVFPVVPADSRAPAYSEGACQQPVRR